MAPFQERPVPRSRIFDVFGRDEDEPTNTTEIISTPPQEMELPDISPPRMEDSTEDSSPPRLDEEPHSSPAHLSEEPPRTLEESTGLSVTISASRYTTLHVNV